jgi:hypothetical protein
MAYTDDEIFHHRFRADASAARTYGRVWICTECGSDLYLEFPWMMGIHETAFYENLVRSGYSDGQV